LAVFSTIGGAGNTNIEKKMYFCTYTLNLIQMKASTFLSALLLLIGLALSACGGSHSHGDAQGGNQAKETMDATDKTGPEYTAAYICPMHCTGSGSDKPGVCPVCGMDYVVNEENGHDHSHDGHDHSH
jgi:hypothetical protein